MLFQSLLQLIFISLGQAVVTMDKAAVWVDGRYHTQAPTEVDCNWLIMKTGRSIRRVQ